MNSMLVAAVLVVAGLFVFGLLYPPSQAQNITNNTSGTPAPGELANATTTIASGTLPLAVGYFFRKFFMFSLWPGFSHFKNPRQDISV